VSGSVQRHSKAFKGVHGGSRSLQRCSKMFVNVHDMFEDDHECSRVFVGVCRCLWVVASIRESRRWL
jgi:hypothetical protein